MAAGQDRMEAVIARPAVRKYWFLLALGLVLGYAAFSYGGVTPVEWNRCLIALGVTAAMFWFTTRARRAEPVSPWLTGLPILVVVYTSLQLVPLPEAMLAQLSPARDRIAAALAGIDAASTWNALSVSPHLTFPYLLRLLAYLLIFLSLRELTARLSERPFVVVVPLLAIASLEAALGLWQRVAGAYRATGTYANANHLAGLLEMSLPFALVLALELAGDRKVVLAAASCVLMFAALLNTLSRTGFTAAVVALVVLAGLRAKHYGRTLAAVTVLAVFAAILFLTVPNDLLDRLADTGGPDVAPDVRFRIWRETLHLIAAYPVFGCGLGTYVSAMQQYRVSSIPLALVDYAHNDYLQLLAEWGVAGFLPALGFVLLLLSRTFHVAISGGRRQRGLAAACFAALVALAIHSFTDFNLYIPVNAMVAAWIGGVAAGLRSSPAPSVESRLSGL
jgi:O-antigen ligase